MNIGYNMCLIWFCSILQFTVELCMVTVIPHQIVGLSIVNNICSVCMKVCIATSTEKANIYNVCEIDRESMKKR